MLNYWARSRSFTDDHSLAIRYADQATGIKRLKTLPIKESTIKLEYCDKCIAWHLVRPTIPIKPL